MQHDSPSSAGGGSGGGLLGNPAVEALDFNIFLERSVLN